MPTTQRTGRKTALPGRARTLGAATVAGLLAVMGLAVITASPAMAATGSGTDSGTTVVQGYSLNVSPSCAAVTTLPMGQQGSGPGALNYTETGSGTYTATEGANTATYNGPLTVMVKTTAVTAYSGPTGSHGYDSTCNTAPGTPFDVTATTTGSSGSSSVSCTYAGTVSRVNPTRGNGTDRSTVTLNGTCTVTQGSVIVASPTDEVRTISYVLGSCIGGPPPITCNVTDTYTATTPSTALTVTTASPLRAATQHAMYSNTLSASGGAGPYTFSLASGSALPAGLTLSSAGVISGTPTTPGSQAFTVAVSDSSSPATTATKQLSLTVNPPLAITTAGPLPAAPQGSPYSQTLAATGGIAPYGFSLVPGSTLPAGLALSPAGIISGTPTGFGPATFSVVVADSSSPANTVTGDFSVTVTAGNLPLSVTTPSPLPAATRDTPYSETLNAIGGIPLYTFSVAADSALPAGLALSAAGVISGTPTSTATLSFSVAVSDSASPATVATKAVSIPVSATTLLVSNGFGPGGSGTVAGYPDPLTGCAGTPAVCDPPPSPFLSGPATGLSQAQGLAQDAAGNLYVASFLPSGGPAVNEYIPGATGNSAPVAVLSGSATKLGYNQGIAIDAAGTHLYVADHNNSITEYALPFTSCTGSVPTCNDAPVATLTGPNTALSSPFGISLDSSGNLYVTEQNDAVTEYAPLAPGTNDTGPIATLSGPATGLHAPNDAVVRDHTLFVTNVGLGLDSVTNYALPLAGCTGTPPVCNQAASVTIAGANAGLHSPSGLAFDPAGNLFVTNFPPSSVTEYSPEQYTTSGDPTPIATIAGPTSNLLGPAYIIVAHPPTMPVSITTTSPLPVATKGSSYHETLAATGGVGPYTFSLASGSSLPAGLSLSPGGIISGTPTARGSSTFTVNVADSSSPARTASMPFTLTVGRANRATTTLTAKPAIGPGHRPFDLTATLRATDRPLSGRTIVFSAGPKVLCRSVTNADGKATCDARTLADFFAIIISGGYTVTFAGAPHYEPSTTHGALLARHRGF